MADATYLPKVYRKAGGDELIVASGGAITVESGGTISNKGTLSSTGTVTLSNIVTFGKASATTISTGATVASSGTLNAKTVNFTKTSTVTLSTGGIFNSSGTLNMKTANVNSGGTLYNKGTLDSTGAISLKGTMALTGVVTATSDGRIVKQHNAYVASSSGAAGNILPYGHALVGSSSAGAHAYKLRKPQTTGDRMTIICRGSSGALTIVPATGAYACKFRGTALKTVITFGAEADGAALDLVAVTSTNWGIAGWSTAWTTTIKCT